RGRGHEAPRRFWAPRWRSRVPVWRRSHRTVRRGATFVPRPELPRTSLRGCSTPRVPAPCSRWPRVRQTCCPRFLPWTRRRAPGSARVRSSSGDLTVIVVVLETPAGAGPRRTLIFSAVENYLSLRVPPHDLPYPHTAVDSQRLGSEELQSPLA